MNGTCQLAIAVSQPNLASQNLAKYAEPKKAAAKANTVEILDMTQRIKPLCVQTTKLMIIKIATTISAISPALI